MAQSEPSLYLVIAELIRRRIADGELKPGDQLPTVRELAEEQECAASTVNRAYRQLIKEGLAVANYGGGTRVAPAAMQDDASAYRWAALVNDAERFLLRQLGRGYTAEQVEASIGAAVTRWAEVRRTPYSEVHDRGAPPYRHINFGGSHDVVLDMLPGMIAEIAPQITMSLSFIGSLGSLMALARDDIMVAGVHLWDRDTDTYNVPFVERMLPGRSIVLVGLFYRALGLMVPKGNPQGIRELVDLTKPGVVLVNRQPGSSFRAWLEAHLQQAGIASESIAMSRRVESIHLGVARSIAEGQATVGMGIAAAADAYGLDFVPLTKERYDLVFPSEFLVTAPIDALLRVLRSERFQKTLMGLTGYDTSITGDEIRVG